MSVLEPGTIEVSPIPPDGGNTPAHVSDTPVEVAEVPAYLAPPARSISCSPPSRTITAETMMTNAERSPMSDRTILASRMAHVAEIREDAGRSPQADLEALRATIGDRKPLASEQRQIDWLEAQVAEADAAAAAENVNALLRAHISRESPTDFATTNERHGYEY